MGEALRRDVEARGAGRYTRARLLAATSLLIAAAAPAPAQQLERHVSGRFTVVAAPSDAPLARTLLDSATARDSFPGLPRPTAPVTIAVAPNSQLFHEWAGSGAPEWGAAVAQPDVARVVMQGRTAGSDAGNPFTVLRHELAHLALHEWMGDLPPRWFDEGYASFCAREWGRDDVLAASIGLLARGVPSLDSLDDEFTHGAQQANTAYALAYRAVSDLAAQDPARGLTLFFRYWRETGSMDKAMRQAYGLTFAAFEAAWRRRTVERYGALAITANLSLAVGIIGLLIMPFWLARRRRDQERLDHMRAAEEAAEAAERESTLNALLADQRGDTPPTESDPTGRPGAP